MSDTSKPKKMLEGANQRLSAIEQQLKVSHQQLSERVKELNCLYGISKIVEIPDISLEEIYQKTVELILASWQYPGITVCRIIMDGAEYKTPNFRKTTWKQCSDITVDGDPAGNIGVYYLEKKPDLDEGPFLKEERLLLEALAERLGRITERKRAEEKLKTGEEKYRLIVENVHDGIEITQDNKIFFTNTHFAEMLGYTVEELTNIPFDQIHTEKAIQDLNERSKKRKAGKILPHNFETTLQKKDGAIIDVDVKYDIIDYNGKPATFAIIRDITQRKLAEEAIKEKDSQLHLITENTRDLIAITALDMKITFIYVSPSYHRFLGYTQEELVGTSSLDFIHPEDKNKMLPLMKKYISAKVRGLLTGKEAEIYEKLEYRVPQKSGGWRYLEAMATLSGKNIVFVSRDITERKQAEKTLRESEERFRRLFWDLGDAVFVAKTGKIDMGNIMEVNPAAEKQTGYTRNELIGMNIIKDISIRGSEELNSDKWDDKLNKGETVTTVEKKRKKDGTEYWTEVVVTPITFKGEKASLSINHDITESKQTEEALKENEFRLRELNATKDKFFNIITHDLKSPFNSIAGFSNLLVEQVREKNYNGIEEYAEIIQKSSNNAMDLLMNLMEWARSQTGRIEFNPENIEMVNLINETSLLFNNVAAQKEISIVKNLPAKAPVFADKAMISTVLRNLISNAVKFTPSGGKIIVSVEKNKTELKVSVSDSGVGISKANIQKLFRIDEIYSTVGTNKEKGTGLGLVLCKDFVEKHEGNIWVESKEGKGSTFCFTVPINNDSKVERNTSVV